MYPDLRELEALFRYVKNYPTALTPNTIRLWRQQLRIAVVDVARGDTREFSQRQINEFMLSMDEALDALRGRPDPKRTSSKKKKDPTKPEVIAVFSHLKSRALEWNRARMAATALYCILMPKIGGRPVELVGAEVDQGVLVLRNAKRAPGQKAHRPISVAEWDLQYRVALAALVNFVDQEVDTQGYQAWLSSLAEILARACKSVEVPRLAPSSFRHTALSTWSAAGYSVEEIAALAGHFCRRSPSHYIRTASAWGPEDAVVQSGTLTELTAKTEAEAAVADIGDGAADVRFEPMPQPVAPPSVPDRSGKLWDEYRQRMEEERKSLVERVDRIKNERSSAAIQEQKPKGADSRALPVDPTKHWP